MTSRPARIAVIVIGALCVLVGVVWIGQGLNLIAGSAMSGDRTWFYVGIVVLIIGIVLLVLGLRPVRRRR